MKKYKTLHQFLGTKKRNIFLFKSTLLIGPYQSCRDSSAREFRPASEVVLPVHGCCQATHRTVLKFPSMAAPGQSGPECQRCTPVQVGTVDAAPRCLSWGGWSVWKQKHRANDPICLVSLHPSRQRSFRKCRIHQTLIKTGG